MVLTKRDKVLLQVIQTCGIMTTKQIAKVRFPGIAMTTVLRRLRILKKAGLLQKIIGLDTLDRCWAVTSKAKRLHLEGPAKIHFPKSILDHDTKLTSLRIKMEGSRISRSWTPEHVLRSQFVIKEGLREAKRRVISDGIMEVEIDGRRHNVAIEMELSPKNQRRYEQIFLDYSLKNNLSFVWYLVPTRTFANQIFKACESRHVPKNGPTVLISYVDEVMRDPPVARIFNQRNTYLIKDLWAQKPAQQTAQPQSRETQENSPGTKAA
jgi:hypothetical protein